MYLQGLAVHGSSSGLYALYIDTAYNSRKGGGPGGAWDCDHRHTLTDERSLLRVRTH
jgi:hypothetical protein